MSDDRPINLKHDRRQWLKASATILGTSLLPGAVSVAEIQNKPRGEIKPEKPGETKASGRLFTPAEHSFVEELTETIIPADSNSGGAKAAKVADYIEQTLRERPGTTGQSDFREGLRLVELISQHYCGKSFVASSSEEKIAVLTVLSKNIDMTELPEVRFFKDVRELTIRGYYSSKIGIHDDLDYKGNVALMEFVGCEDAPTKST
jgi:glucoside 3-dehydrogenase (cytochrome c) hitch-hiker subunit